jgi:hypothetical protein
MASHKPIEMFKESKMSKALASSITGGESGAELDCHFWLPSAAEQYCLSRNLSDYIMIPVPTIVSDMPNTNGVSFPRGELIKFNPDAGRLAFKTFKGKPTHAEHANQDIKQAKGVILDVFATPLKGFAGNKLIKIVELLSFDRSKDPALAADILSGAINSYSMGAYFEGYACSLCGKGRNQCRHTGPKEPLYKMTSGELVYRNIFNIGGFETSAVKNPAFCFALSNKLMRTS